MNRYRPNDAVNLTEVYFGQLHEQRDLLRDELQVQEAGRHALQRLQEGTQNRGQETGMGKGFCYGDTVFENYLS